MKGRIVLPKEVTIGDRSYSVSQFLDHLNFSGHLRILESPEYEFEDDLVKAAGDIPEIADAYMGPFTSQHTSEIAHAYFDSLRRDALEREVYLSVGDMAQLFLGLEEERRGRKGLPGLVYEKGDVLKGVGTTTFDDYREKLLQTHHYISSVAGQDWSDFIGRALSLNAPTEEAYNMAVGGIPISKKETFYREFGDIVTEHFFNTEILGRREKGIHFGRDSEFNRLRDLANRLYKTPNEADAEAHFRDLGVSEDITSRFGKLPKERQEDFVRKLIDCLKNGNIF